MATNSNLHMSRTGKTDEFYTQLSTIEEELRHYRKYFKNKVVLCNCDDPYESNFFKYFAINFNHLKLKKLIATNYDSSPFANTQFSLSDNNENAPIKKAYKIEINNITDINNDGKIDLFDVEQLLKDNNNVLTELKGNGDFRSEECIKLLK